MMVSEVSSLASSHAYDFISGNMKAVPSRVDLLEAGIVCKDVSSMSRHFSARHRTSVSDKSGPTGVSTADLLAVFAKLLPKAGIIECGAKFISSLDYRKYGPCQGTSSTCDELDDLDDEPEPEDLSDEELEEHDFDRNGDDEEGNFHLLVASSVEVSSMWCS